MAGGYYTSDAFQQLESKNIFRRNWIYLGRANEVKEPGASTLWNWLADSYW